MYSRLLEPVGISGYSAAAFAAVLLIIVRLSQPSKLNAIPTAGSISWLGSWWAGFKYVTNAAEVIQEGYEKHKRAPFKVAMLHRWMVILSSHEHIEELRRAPDNLMSFADGLNDKLQVEYTMGHGVYRNPYHTSVMRSQLTRNIGELYPDMRDEFITAFDDILSIQGSEWKSVPAFRTIQEVVCRTTNRLFVGLPLCRDPDWMDLTLKYTQYIIKGATIIKLFPTFLKPLATQLFTYVIQSNKRGRKILRPIIEERQRRISEYGNKWADKPNDLLSWLMEEAEGPELTVQALTARMLTCNFAGIHTTSTAFTNALFFLAANPQYIRPLREEVEAIVEKEGWSEAALRKLPKVDSFLRESIRMQSFSVLSMLRETLKDHTLSDGTFLPRGTVIAGASRCVHYDEEFYPNAHTFEPFRFAELREDEGTKHQLVSTTPEYLAFGHGRHACPGRFFAAIELKSMLAHVVVTYDVKFEDNAAPVQTYYIGESIAPDLKANVMFRRRII